MLFITSMKHIIEWIGCNSINILKGCYEGLLKQPPYSVLSLKIMLEEIARRLEIARVRVRERGAIVTVFFLHFFFFLRQSLTS